MLSGREVLLVIRARDEASRVLRGLSGTMLTTDRAAQRTAQHMIGAGIAMTSLGTGLAYVGATGAFALGKAAKTTIDYRQQVAKTKTQVDGFKASMKQLGQVGIDVASQIPIPFEQTQEALYDIFSSMDVGLKGGRKLLFQFARDAVAGSTDLQTATRGNIAIMNSYKIATKDVSDVSDFMFQLVRKGVGTYEEFTKTIGRAIPSAVNAGQSYKTLGGMLAFLTRNGMSTAMSATSAARALDAIAHPDTIKRMEKMGITVKDADGEFKPLVSILGQLNEQYKDMTAPERAAALKELFLSSGGTIQARRFFNSVFKNFDEFKQRVKEMNDSAGQADKAYNIMFKRPQAQIQLLQNQLKILAINFGSVLLPWITKAAQGFGALVKWFNELDPSIRRLIVKTITLITILTTLTGVTLALTGTFVMLLGALKLAGIGFGTFLGLSGLVVAAIAGIGYGAYELVKNWESVGPFFQDLWSDIEDRAVEFASHMSDIWDVFVDAGVIDAARAVVDRLIDVWDSLGVVWHDLEPTVDKLGNLLKSLADHSWDVLDVVAKLIAPVVVGGLHALEGALMGVAKVIELMSSPTGIAAVALIGLQLAIRKLTLSAGMHSRTLGGLGTIFTDIGTSATTLAKRIGFLRGGAGIAGLALMMANLGDSSTGAGQALKSISTVASHGLLGFAVGGPIGMAIGAGAGALSLLAQKSDEAAEAQQRLDEYVNTLADHLNKQTGAITKQAFVDIYNRVKESGLFDIGKEFGVQADLITDYLAGVPGSTQKMINNVERILANMPKPRPIDAETMSIGEQEFWTKIQVRYEERMNRFQEFKDLLKQEKNAVADAQLTWKDRQHAMEFAGIAMDKLRTKQQQLTYATKLYNREQEESTQRALMNTRGQLGLQQTILAANEAIRDGKDGLNKHTQAGIDNYNILLDIADQWNTSTKKVQQANGAYKDIREEFIRVAKQMGVDDERAHKLANRFLEVPPNAKKAKDAIDDMAKGVARSLKSINDERVNINLTPQASAITSALKIEQLKAAGGPIFGGRPGKDSVPALLMPNEHVWTTKEVQAIGGGNFSRGHQIMYILRKMALSGELVRHGDLQPFAGGGAVDVHSTLRNPGPAIASVERQFDAIAAAVSKRMSDLVNKFFTWSGSGLPLGPHTTLTPAQWVRGQQFARAQVGKPYIWGGVGPGGYDCSGFQSAILNAALGRYPYRRLGSTASMPWAGSSPGRGGYTIGWSKNVGGTGIGHTSGNIGGLNVESYGGHGPAVGSGARSPLDSMFYGLMHYDWGGVLRPGFTLAYNGTGHNEYVMNPARFADGGKVAKKAREVKFGKDEKESLQIIARRVRNIPSNASVKEILRIIFPENWENIFKRMATERLAKWMTTAFARGLKRADTSQVQSAVKELGGRIDEYFQKALSAKDLTTEQRKAIRDRMLEIKRQLHSEAQDLVTLASQREKVANRLERANDRLRNVIAARNEFRKSIVAPFKELASVLSIESPSTYKRLDARDILGTLRQRLAKARKYSRMLRRLRRMGLSNQLYRDLLTAGPEAGFETAHALLEGGERAVRRASSLSAQITETGQALAQRAGQQFYAQGIRAAEAYVRQLQRKRKELARIAEHMANALVREMRQELQVPRPRRNRRRGDHRGRRGPIRRIDVKQYISTTEINPRRHARELGWELARRIQ